MQCLGIALSKGVWFYKVNDLTEFESEQVTVIDYYARMVINMNDEQLYILANLQVFLTGKYNVCEGAWPLNFYCLGGYIKKHSPPIIAFFLERRTDIALTEQSSLV